MNSNKWLISVSVNTSMITSRKSIRLFSAVFLSAVFVATLCFFFEPCWETNDDVASIMKLHGYGTVAVSSPRLIFSNILWGDVVQAIPTINGIVGYSIATLAVLALTGAILLYVVSECCGWPIAIFVCVLVLTRPVLFPQFTINAGLLAVAAIVCWHIYGTRGSKRALFGGCLLFLFSYLIRRNECLLVLLIATPLLPWLKLVRERVAGMAALCLMFALVMATFIDHQAYQGEDWRAFNALNSVRMKFSDYGAGRHLKRHPEILARHGYTANDINLIANWFFVDPQIANPVRLQAMLADLGPLLMQEGTVAKGLDALKAFSRPILLPIFAVALFLSLLFPHRKIVATLLLTVALFLWIGSQGRPGVLRIYIPVVALLVISPLLLAPYKKIKHGLALAALILAVIFNTASVWSESKKTQIHFERIRHDMRNFPTEPIVTWGGNVFPFEAVYPVLRRYEPALSYQLYGLGVAVLAPTARSFAEEKKRRGFIERLLSQDGVPIVAHKSRVGLLRLYCQEHFSGELRELARQQFGQVSVQRLQCYVPAQQQGI